VRSAVYAAATTAERREAHAALAGATDPHEVADRRAWHLALAAPGPDEEVAAELERSARRAQARGGLAAAAALLERSAALTAEPVERTARTIAAAEAHIEAGASEAAARLLSVAEAAPLDNVGRGRTELLRWQLASVWGDRRDMASLLLHNAGRIGRIDARLARDTYLGALGAAATAHDLARGASLEEVARTARTAPPPDRPLPRDLLLDGLAVYSTDGPAAAAPALRRAVDTFLTAQLSDEEVVRWFGYPYAAASVLWDWESLRAFADRSVRAARELGALRVLPLALNVLAMNRTLGGDLVSAAALIGEAESIVDATGARITPYATARLAASRGHAAQAIAVIDGTIERARRLGDGHAIKVCQSATAVLWNGLGRYQEALHAARLASDGPPDWSPEPALHELVEAAARSGDNATARRAIDQLSESAQASGTDWALGIEARSRALLSAGDVAESFYLDGIERLERSPVRPEAARAHLLYGEWLRREKRRTDARRHLRDAHERLSSIGMEAFAERARRELAATGEAVRKRTVGTTYDLTAQESQIAQLAGEGSTNREIGAQLFISANTVEYHLKKVFTKMGVMSRTQLRERLAGRSPPVNAGT
jgi:DNA-binding CsgD family transcriptional regulator